MFLCGKRRKMNHIGTQDTKTGPHRAFALKLNSLLPLILLPNYHCIMKKLCKRFADNHIQTALKWTSQELSCQPIIFDLNIYS